MSRPCLLVLATIALLHTASGCSQPCDGEVWMQVQNYYPETFTVAVSSFAPICSEDGATLTTDAQLDVPENLDGFDAPYVSSDPEPGSTFVFTIVSDGALANESLSCDITAEGVSLTYAQVTITAVGEILCGCGFEEYDDPDVTCE